MLLSEKCEPRYISALWNLFNSFIKKPNHIHNPLIQFDVWPNFFQYNKWNKVWLLAINCYIRLSWRFVKRLKTSDLRKFGNIRKSQNFIWLLPSASSSSWNEKFVSTTKNLLKNRNWTFPVVHYLTWKLEFMSKNMWMIVSEHSFVLLTCPKPLQICFVWQFR